MKILLFTLLALSGIASGVSLRVEWDAYPNAQHYRVWRGIEVLATVSGTQATLDLPSDDSSTLTVTAITWDVETAHSPPLEVYVAPLPKLTNEFSSDLQNWHESFLPTDHFARARINSH